jgi:uncharacterized protein (TIGR02001 family)
MVTLRQTTRINLACSVALFCLASPASSQDRPELELSATVGATSDYVFRGLSLNGERPAAQASLDVSYGIFYAGVWASNISGVGLEPVEVDFYSGIRPQWGAVTFDFGAIWYTYPGASTGPLGEDGFELKAGMAFSPITGFLVSPVFWYVPDQTHSPETRSIESTFAYTMPNFGIFTPTVSSLIGYTEAVDFFGPDDDYAYWNAGLSLTVETVTLDFRYWDTSIGNDGLFNERFVFSTTFALP